MKIIIEDEKNHRFRLNETIEWLIGMVGYALILIAVSLLFPKTLQIDSNLFGLWALVAAIITFILNKTIKPILFWLTLPITGLTLGLFYPFLNVFILDDDVLQAKDVFERAKNYFGEIVKTPVQKRRKKRGGELVTSKRDGKNHGLGTKIVKDTVRKYDGKCSFDFADGKFTASVYIPNEISAAVPAAEAVRHGA